MGLFDVTSKVLTVYKADTSDQIKGLKKLKGAEAELHAEQLKRAQAENEKLENQIKMVGKLAAGFAAYQIAVGVAGRAMDAYGKSSSEAAAKVQRIKESTDRAFNGIFAAIGRVVVELEPLIGALADVSKLVADIVSGAVDLFSGEYADRSKLPKQTREALEKFDQMWNGGMAGTDKRASRTWGQFYGDLRSETNQIQADAARREEERKAAELTWGKAGKLLGDSILDGVRRGLGVDEWGAPIQFDKNGKPIKGGPRAGRWSDVAGGIAGYTDRDGEIQFYDSTGGLGMRADDRLRDEFGREIGLDTEGPLRKLLDEKAAAEADRLAEGRSFLEQTFGPVDQFNAYATAFEMLTGAVTASLEAWIDGSQSASEAFKSFIGAAIKSLSTMMMTEGIKHGAYALGSLAIGDAPGAARHLAASSAFLSGAAWSAVAAKAMGAGGSSGGGGAAPTGAGGSGSAPSGAGSANTGPQTNVTIVTGDSFSDDSPRNRRLRAERLWERARGTSGVIHE